MKQFYFLTFLTFLFFGQSTFGQCEWNNNFTNFIPTSDGAILVGDPNPQVDEIYMLLNTQPSPFNPGNGPNDPNVDYVTFTNDDLDDGQYELTGIGARNFILYYNIYLLY